MSSRPKGPHAHHSVPEECDLTRQRRDRSTSTRRVPAHGADVVLAALVRSLVARRVLSTTDAMLSFAVAAHPAQSTLIPSLRIDLRAQGVRRVGDWSSRHSTQLSSPAAMRCSRCRTSTRRIFPEMVLGRSLNSIRRMRWKGASCSRAKARIAWAVSGPGARPGADRTASPSPQVASQHFLAGVPTVTATNRRSRPQRGSSGDGSIRARAKG